MRAAGPRFPAREQPSGWLARIRAVRAVRICPGAGAALTVCAGRGRAVSSGRRERRRWRGQLSRI